jgi:acid phosphatase type 7
MMTNGKLGKGHDIPDLRFCVRTFYLHATIIFNSLAGAAAACYHSMGCVNVPTPTASRTSEMVPSPCPSTCQAHTMSPLRFSIAVCLLLSAASASSGEDAVPKPAASPEQSAESPLLVKPYLQLGHKAEPGKLDLLWHTPDSDETWSVDYRPGIGRRWQPARPASFRRIAVVGVEPHRVYHVALTDLEPGQTFSYRLSQGSKALFQAEARTPSAADQPQRFVVFGDCGAGTPEERAIAYRAFLSEPDMVMITGDIVYDRGRVSEYRVTYWPVYTAEEPSPLAGAPLLPSTLFVAAPGNHDIAGRDLGEYPDGLAYFYYWRQPLNGPKGEVGGPLVAPILGPEANIKAFRDAAGEAFPRMASFSFECGNAHWTILDANPTVDWTDSNLQEWVAADLAQARDATWRFVNFHQPGFNSAKTHFDEQAMRVLAPVFEAGKVDVVFNGHVHNYQRSYPLRFVPDPASVAASHGSPGASPPKTRLIGGTFTLDKSFDGRRDTSPEGVIYVITGAGGQHLYNPEQQDDPASWQEFTYKFVSKMHSLTVADIHGRSLTVRQLTADGREIDRFVIKK